MRDSSPCLKPGDSGAIPLVEDGSLSGILNNSIRGRGAFRRFKDAVHRLGIADEWYRFRDQAYKETAIEWCGDNGVEFDED